MPLYPQTSLVRYFSHIHSMKSVYHALHEKCFSEVYNTQAFLIFTHLTQEYNILCVYQLIYLFKQPLNKQKILRLIVITCGQSNESGSVGVLLQNLFYHPKIIIIVIL